MAEESDYQLRKEEELKQRVLEETFRKAEGSSGSKIPNKEKPKKIKKKSYEKLFPKVGILLIIFSIIGLVFISNVPWACIKYGKGTPQTESWIYQNYKGDNVESQEISNLFIAPYYIGLTKNDFSVIPKYATFAFISLIIIGILVSIFGVIDRYKNFSLEMFSNIHYIFSTVIIIPSLYLIMLVIKFLGSHFLIINNGALISESSITLLFPNAIIITIMGVILIRLAFTLMRMDFTGLHKIKEVDSLELSSATYTVGGNI